MANDRAKRPFGAALTAMRIRIILIAGLLPVLAGCPSESSDSNYYGPWPPKAPIQRMFICDRTIGWELPREREHGDYLAEAEIKTVTIYAARIPMAPKDELAFIMDVDPYLLQWQFLMLEPGAWFFRLTATDNDGEESEISNERSNEECL